MMEYLCKLPYETLGQNMLGYLDLVDIIQWENAAASQKSKELFRAILPYCPAIVIKPNAEFEFNFDAVNWFNNKRLSVQRATIHVESMCELNIQHYIFNNIELCWKENISLQDMELLKNNFINQRVSQVKIKGNQDPAVMEMLFSLLNNSSVHSLDIESLNLSQWMEHIKKIGQCLRHVSIQDDVLQSKMITTITGYCPYLEKLNLKSVFDVLHSITLLNTIATNCQHIRSLDIARLGYPSNTEADADLTAFAEKSPQLEELTLNCKQQPTEQSVITLAQHYSRLKKLKLYTNKLTVASLIALSERGLPLEELDILPSIPIPSAEIAAQCAHALSRIRILGTSKYHSQIEAWLHAIQYMTGLRDIVLESSEDHLLVSQLLQLQGHCVNLERLTIHANSSITTQQLCVLVTGCSNLRTLYNYKSTCISDAVLVELAHSSPHLQEVKLSCSVVTEEGVLALAAHCRQLKEVFLSYVTLTEETVRQLAQHCRHLTKLGCKVFTVSTHQKYQNWSSSMLRELREG